MDPFQSNYRKQWDLSMSSLPKGIDLSPWMSKIEDQGGIGSCSANALGSVLEYLIKRKYHLDIELSRLFIYYNGRGVDRQNGAVWEQGATLTSTAQALEWYGDCEEYLWPYKKQLVDEEPPSEVYEAARHYTIVPMQVPINLHSLKASLADGFPVVIGIYLRYSAGREAKRNRGYIRIPSSPSSLAFNSELHAIVLCGYDDDIQHFLVRNSWGEKWGSQGYVYLPYEYLFIPPLVNFDDGAWTIRDIEYNAQPLPPKHKHHKAERYKDELHRSSSDYGYYWHSHQLDYTSH